MKATAESESSFFDIPKWRAFFLITLVTIFMLIAKKVFLENDTAAFEILESRGQMGVFHTLNTLQYVSVPLIYLIKFTVIAFILWVGCFMFGYKVTFGQVWQVVVISEFIFFIPETIKLLWLLLVESDPDLHQIKAFYPLSLINLTDTDELAGKWFYPLKALNVFEVIYWFLLAAGIHHMANKRKEIAYAIVFSSYVLMFILWLGFFAVVYK
ncbi:sulfate ABC transporter permease [Fulvivirga ligni]|uniref:sulfate ABC transporter permease n=1 Tax=Fulvivirga ligni TaxID=2904246 RepID=UPI001F403ED3|nr:sulfate ABC transporter permease [Fulvivirga ligni]UII21836.1 sulfate ABC transporter permease [Fulvivirga ligni]